MEFSCAAVAVAPPLRRACGWFNEDECALNYTEVLV
jgi:hypothetical protein